MQHSEWIRCPEHPSFTKRIIQGIIGEIKMKKNLGGFALKTLLGITSFKRNLSRKIGIPMTKCGRQRKAGSGNLAALIFTFFLDL